MKRLFLVITLMLISMSVFSETIERDGISYNLNCDTKEAAVTAGTNPYKGDITIPTSISINGQIFNVTSIEDAAFCGCEELQSVCIPSSIINIGYGIFSGCNTLTNIVVSNDNMVYDSRYDCNAIIETATNTLIVGCNNSTIPCSVQSIASRAFEKCTKLTKVNIPNAVIELGGFTGCENLSEINIPNSVSFIKSSTFNGCKSLKSIKLPQGIQWITYACFANSGLQSISIPNGVNCIEQRAFSMCKDLEDVIIPNSVKSIGEYAFENCDALKTIKIPKSIETLNDNVFQDCSNLQTVYLPGTLKSIGGSFYSCSKISDVYCFAEEVPITDSYNFYFPSIDNNTTLHVPTQSIDKYKSASGWSRFTKIVALTEEDLKIYDDEPLIVNDEGIEGIYKILPDSYRVSGGRNQEYGNFDPPIEIAIKDNGDGTFYVDDLFGGWYWYRTSYGPNYAMTGNIVIAEDGTVTLKDSHVIGWDDSLISLTGSYDASTSTFKIEAEYVNGITFYQTWVKDKQVVNIDGVNCKITSDNNASVVKGCYSGVITIPNIISYNDKSYPITSIVRAFEGCSGLTSVTIPNSIISLEEGSFSGCSNLTSVTIPNSIISLKDGLFTGCSNLVAVTIPNSIVTIGSTTFAGCVSLTSMTIPNSVVSIGDLAFCACNSLSNLTLSDKLATIGKASFSECHNLKSLVIPASVLKIGADAFCYCESLESIKVDKKNTKYDSRDNCNAIIETVTNELICGTKNTVIPNSVTSIGTSAFFGCLGLTSITIPNSVTSIGNYAFDGCTDLISVTVENETPVAIKENTFTNSAEATLYVPEGSLEKYKAAPVWKDFKSIQAIGSTGIKGIEMIGGETFDVYNLYGLKVKLNATSLDGLPRGIYIVKGKKIMK